MHGPSWLTNSARSLSYLRLLLGLSCAATASTAAADRVFVANAISDDVSIVDVATSSVLQVAGLPRATGIAFSKDGSKAYVTSGAVGLDAVYVLDTATNALVNTIHTGGDTPIRMAISPDGTIGYVTQISSSTVAVIDTATDTVIDTIPTGSGPYGVVFSIDGQQAYVANQTSNTISVIDVAAGAAVDTIPVGTTVIREYSDRAEIVELPPLGRIPR